MKLKLLTRLQQVELFLKDTKSVERNLLTSIGYTLIPGTVKYNRLFHLELAKALQIAALKGFRRFRKHVSFSQLDGDLEFLKRATNLANITEIEEHFAAVALSASKRLTGVYSRLLERRIQKGVIAGLTPKQIDPRPAITLAIRDQINIAYRIGHESAIDEVSDLVVNQEYVAILDDRVRPEHLARHGTVLPRNHWWWRFNTPPIEPNCRCTIIYNFVATKQNTSTPPEKFGVTKPTKAGTIRIVEPTDKRSEEIRSIIPEKAFNINFQGMVKLRSS